MNDHAHTPLIFQPVDLGRAAGEVERQIETLILEGVLRSGDRLPGERDLAVELGVSRPIVRDALAALEARHLLITHHGGGTFVADVIGTVFAPPVVELISRNSRAKSDYMAYRREMEGMTAAMAARHATAADLDLLARIVDDMRAAHAKQDADREAALDVEFHSAIGEAAHNIILLHTLRSCYRLLADDVFANRSLVYESTSMRDALLDQHLAIFERVAASDPKSAEETARAHINFIEQATREAEQREDRSAVSARRLAQRMDKKRQARPRTGGVTNGSGRGKHKQNAVS